MKTTNNLRKSISSKVSSAKNKSSFTHKLRALTSQEVNNNRSKAYEYLPL